MFEIRQDRQIPQGRRKLHAERAKYFELVANGYGFLEAARIVGVNYRTTKRWRSGVWTSGTKKKAERSAGTVTRVLARTGPTQLRRVPTTVGRAPSPGRSR